LLAKSNLKVTRSVILNPRYFAVVAKKV